MGGYRVDPAQLAEVERAVRGAAAAARDGLAELRAAAADTLSNGWQSPAGTVFRAGWDGWVDGIVAMLGALDLLGEAVGAAGSDYAGADAAVDAAVRRAAS
ncbi:WXG100 family type VII secretion target [uncultured Jatrophihabitans sp.]|uniref:WXG100 family type VII secretion target n=1 Tax=uncultured Jatrophihabitans sp. TaxID=1610747 RepID=UPI0035CB6F7F